MEGTTQESLKRFRLTAVRLAIPAVLLLAGAAWLIDAKVAYGLAIGGISGVLGFWLLAVQMTKYAGASVKQVHRRMALWRGMELLLFAAALYRAYLMDTTTLKAFVAAAAGLFIIRIVVAVVGIFGLDLKADEERQ